MKIEIRSGIRAAALMGDTPEERQAWRFTPDPRERDADPAAIRAQAQLNEADGFDSALVTTYSSWPDPWLVAALALESAPGLRVAVAHRPGVVQPTATARTFATLDRLSGGRASMHVVIGSSDVDVQRDGDFSSKEERYRRAFEYLDIVNRTLDATEPFDFEGQYYRVRDAWSGFAPVQRPRPPISIGGTSEAAKQLAARFGDVYAGAYATPEEVARTKADIEHRYGRRLRFWKSFSVVLGDTDRGAREIASELVERGRSVVSERTTTDLSTSAQLAPAGELLGRKDAVFTDIHGLAANYVGNAVSGSLVGAVETVAERLAQFCQAGIDIVQIDTNTETASDRAARRALVEVLRQKIAAGAE